MSHFTVMVIGAEPEKQLAPFNENLEVEWIDKTQDFKDEYETKKVSEFYCSSSSSWGFEITKELFELLKKSKVGMNTSYKMERQPLHYLKEGGKYRGYYPEGNKRCKGEVWFEVEKVVKTNHPNEDICFEGEVIIRKIAAPKQIALKEKYPNYADYLKDWHGGEDMIKQGYWDNPNSKWDWYDLGGRWSGLIKTKPGKKGIVGIPGVFDNEAGIDQAKKGDIANLNEIITFAIIKDGKWYERGEMGWWGCVSNKKPNDQWDREFKNLLKNLPDDVLISIYDCHI